MTEQLRGLVFLVGLATAAGLGGYVRGRASVNRAAWEAARDSALGVERGAWQEQLEQLYAGAREALRVADSALEAAAEEHREADRHRAARQAIPLPALTPADCAPWAEALSLCEQEAEALRRSIAADADAFRALQNVAEANNNRALLAEDRVGSLERLLRTAPGARGWPKWLTATAGCALGAAAGRWGLGLDEASELAAACFGGGLGVTWALPTR